MKMLSATVCLALALLAGGSNSAADQLKLSDVSDEKGDGPDGKGNTGSWISGRIRDLLNNPVYAGEIRNGDSTLPGSHQAMVSKDTFEAAQRHLKKRRIKLI